MFLRSLLSLVGVAALSACAGNPPPPEASTLLQDVRAAMLAVESMRAEATMTRFSEREGEEQTRITVEMAGPGRFRSRSEFIGETEFPAVETLYLNGVGYTRSEGGAGSDGWHSSMAVQPSAEGPIGFLVPPDDLEDPKAIGETIDGAYVWVLRGRLRQGPLSSDQVEVVEPSVTDWTAHVDPESKLVLRVETITDHGMLGRVDELTGRIETTDMGTSSMTWRGYDYNQPITVNAPAGVSLPTPEPTPTPRGVPFAQVLTFEAGEEVAPEVWDEVTAVVEERLAAMHADEYEIGVRDPPGVLTLRLGAGTLTEEQARQLVEPVGRVEIIERRCLANPCKDDGNHQDVPTGWDNEEMASASAWGDSAAGNSFVFVRLHDEAIEGFGNFTRHLFETGDSGMPDELAFALDGEVLMSAPLRGPMTGGTFQIVGDFSQSESQVVAALISADPAPVSLRFVRAENLE